MFAIVGSMNKGMLATLVTVGCAFGSVACGGDDSAPLDPDAVWQVKGPTALDTRVATAARGTFEVNTTVDVNALAVAPQNVVDALHIMRVFGDDPGGAIVNEADRAGVPAMKTLHDALPDVANDGLNGLITDAIVKGPRGNQVRGAMTGIADLMDATLFQFDIVSEISLPENAGARGTGSMPLAAWTSAACAVRSPRASPT